MKRSGLLEPETWDALELVGTGFSAQVRRSGRYAVKIAHPGGAFAQRLREEAANFAALGDLLKTVDDARLRVPRLLEVAQDARALVRDHVRGSQMDRAWREAAESDRALIEELFAEWLSVAERFAAQTGHAIDVTPTNLIVSEGPARIMTLVDLGMRLDPSPFSDVRGKAAIHRALIQYSKYRAAIDRAAIVPTPWPPSGRFTVPVPCGPEPSGRRVLWTNETALQRYALPWTKADILRHADVFTTASSPTRVHVATRYQDSAGTGEGHAQGDGRALWLGAIKATARGSADVMAKGIGPTPLIWSGNPYHEDGYVSFQRTLWETTVCDELARLGFETPEVLALYKTGAVTVDQTDEEWPAAGCLRIATTQYRLGHVLRVQEDADAFSSIVTHVGQQTLGSDFSAKRKRDLKALHVRFCENHGYDTGRTDALNIHCFNPTLGNVRIDGHLIDFSTVRFHRHYYPGFIYMNATRRISEHRAAHRKTCHFLPDAYVSGGLLSKARADTLMRQGLTCFDDAYIRGYLDGVRRFMGVADSAPRLAPRRARELVEAVRAVRTLRADASVTFDFWKQRVKAPLIDFEGRLPEYIAAHRARAGGDTAAAPWRVLRSRFVGIERAPDVRRLNRFDDLMGRALDVWGQVAPLVWNDIVRPMMEPEALAELCYRKSTPERFGAWKRLMSTSRCLPAGHYAAETAKRTASAAGHVVRTSLSGRKVLVVGLLPEIDEGLFHVVCDLWGDRLVAAVLTGVRVGPSGPVDEPATPLHVTLLIRGDDEERSAALRFLSRSLTQLYAPFAFDVQLVRVEGAASSQAAARAWLDDAGISADEAVLVAGPDGPYAPVRTSSRM